MIILSIYLFVYNFKLYINYEVKILFYSFLKNLKNQGENLWIPASRSALF